MNKHQKAAILDFLRELMITLGPIAAFVLLVWVVLKATYLI